MAITLKQLQEHLPSPEEQEDSARQVKVVTTQLLSYFTQQFEDIQKEAFSDILQQFEDMRKSAWSGILRQFEDVQKVAWSGISQQIQLMQKTLRVSELYSIPAFTPLPPYLRQSQPQIIYVFIDDLPGLN